MTVIAAAVTGKNRVTIAADSEATAGWQKANLAAPKLWVAGTFAFGACGSLRAAQVLRHHVEWPEPSAADMLDFEAFLIRLVVPAIRLGIRGHGVIEKRKGSMWLPCDIIIAKGNSLASIEGDGCVTSDPSGRMAIGSGYAEALGYLGDEGPWKGRDLVEAARRASISAVGVGGPINVVDTKALQVCSAE